MADNKLKIIFEAEDKASAEISGIGKSLDTLNDSAKTLTKAAAADALKDIGFAGMQAFDALKGAAGEFIDLAGEAQLVSAKLDAQLKALGEDAPMTRDGLDEIANSMSKITRFDDEAILEAEGRLLSFTTVGKEQFPLVMKAAANLAEQMGMGLPEAVQLLGRSLETGTVAPLKRAGVVFDEETNKMITNFLELGETGKAQEMMLQGIEDRIGGVAEAAGTTFPGKMAIMQTAVDNMKESIGMGFIDVFEELPKPLQDAGLAASILGPNLVGVVGPLVQMAGAIAQLKIAGGLGAIFGLGGAGATIASIAAAALPILALVVAIGGLIAVINRYGAEATKTVVMIDTIITGSFNRLIFEAKKFGGDFVKGIGEGITSSWNWLKTTASNLAIDLLNSIKSTLGIKSPSKVMAEQVGKPMLQGAMVGFSQNMPGMAASMGGGLASMTPAYGRGQIIINYSPGMSLGNQSEFETQFIPMLERALRKVNRGTI